MPGTWPSIYDDQGNICYELCEVGLVSTFLEKMIHWGYENS